MHELRRIHLDVNARDANDPIALDGGNRQAASATQRVLILADPMALQVGIEVQLPGEDPALGISQSSARPSLIAY
jgi:hypothetical protein